MLTCSLHPKKEKDEEDIARALTPTKSIPMAVAAQNPEGLVLLGKERIPTRESIYFYLMLFVYSMMYGRIFDTRNPKLQEYPLCKR